MAAPKAKKKGAAGPSIEKLMPIITGVLAIAYAVAVYFLLYVPKLGSVVEGGAYDTTALEARVAEDRAYLETLKAAGETLKQVNPEHRSRVSGIVPLEADVPGLFVEMDALSKNSGMVLVSIDTIVNSSDPTPLGMKSVTIAMNLAGGTYEQFKRFLGDVERTLRVTDVRNVTFTPGSGSYGVVMTTYFLDRNVVLGPDAAPAQ